ncbi:STAS domain-containing protein [Streptomyces sp. NPDC006662]|uniref:STAS domain-containing protein n=1 Tax=Streptomyces sp. NPDC006662 TaxID=3156902 RepID=UPI0033CA5C6B
MNESTAVNGPNLRYAHTVITVVGDMDIKSHPELQEAGMDSSGLKVLLVLRRRLSEAGGCLTVTGLRCQPRALLVLTGTSALLTHNTREPDEVLAKPG